MSFTIRLPFRVLALSCLAFACNSDPASSPAPLGAQPSAAASTASTGAVSGAASASAAGKPGGAAGRGAASAGTSAGAAAPTGGAAAGSTAAAGGSASAIAGASGRAGMAGASAPDDDAGPNDAGPNDAGPNDAGPNDAGAPDASSCADCCADGFPRGAAKSGTRRIAPFTPSPEGVTVCPDGAVFVALDGSGEVWRVPLDGTAPEMWAKLGDRRPAGLTCDDQGRLFVTTFSTLSGDPGSLAPTLITAKGETPRQLPEPTTGPKIGGLNGIVAVQGVGVYTSDSGNNSLLLVQEPTPNNFTTRVVANDVSLGNGLAYEPKAHKLYAVASGAGQVLTFTIASDGTLSQRGQAMIKNVPLFIDGTAVDANGGVYIADYLGGNVLSAASGASVAKVENPASLIFHGGTLLITDYKLMAPTTAGGLYAVDLGVCGPGR